MRVALVGARGHGARHVENLLRLGHDGVATFVGVVDVADVGDVPVPSYPDLPSLAAELHPEVVLISSPPSTHRDLVLDAFELGCDVLVEKPALLSVADYEEIAAAAVKRGLVCQVGFQSQGTGSYRRLCSLIGSGALGDISGIGAAGRWVRTDSYYERATWAGRQGEDGTLVNPFAHALQNALLLADVEERSDITVELELFRCRDTITADDTACVRVTADGVPPVVVATTLCASTSLPPVVLVHGSLGQAVWWYDDDRLTVNDHKMAVPPPVDLLENLIRHRQTGAPLVAPLAAARAFTSVVEQCGKADVPLLPARRMGDRVILDGIDEVVVRAAEKIATFDELGCGFGR
ncbi:Gfo/Idh/MocA family oxidoreductase [Lentzea sp. NEAU-D13]|uniref:Gfo/Idh/MocA family oxidoreductase n=1 Tax=Lentzea alba TaxID=2714351 RepID=A0A7C9VYV9_9PSEU|nr:Gfo/Idh/MocA family oxidoreductase [Lentzea alba]NGY65495.1 Gfo/Idh/MocA family oxidoreductase [Lentzea alba]